MPRQTFFAKASDFTAQGRHVDADGMVLGRLASRIAMHLMGKHLPTYTPHVDTGDFVIILNAGKVKVTGRKDETMTFETYSKYPGGRHVYSYKDMIARRPEKVIEVVVKRMLPKSKMGRNILGKLKIYKGTEHPHQAQQPKELKLAKR